MRANNELTLPKLPLPRTLTSWKSLNSYLRYGGFDLIGGSHRAGTVPKVLPLLVLLLLVVLPPPPGVLPPLFLAASWFLLGISGSDVDEDSSSVDDVLVDGDILTGFLFVGGDLLLPPVEGPKYIVQKKIVEWYKGYF